MKYRVTVRRKEFRETTFEVEAKNPGEAAEIATEQSWDFDFNQVPVQNADEEVISIEERK